MPSCPQCDRELLPDSAFCVECGHKLGGTPSPSWGLREVGLALVGLVGLGLFYRGVFPPKVAAPTPTAAPSSPSPTAIPVSLPTLTPVSTPESTPVTPEVTILYRVQEDLDGDGNLETAQVVALDGNPQPNSNSRKVLRIYAMGGRMSFESEAFEEPFHTDLDHLAEKPEEKAGLWVVKGEGYPRLRMIFATRSGNYVDYRFDGQNYDLAGMGD